MEAELARYLPSWTHKIYDILKMGLLPIINYLRPKQMYLIKYFHLRLDALKS